MSGLRDVQITGVRPKALTMEALVLAPLRFCTSKFRGDECVRDPHHVGDHLGRVHRWPQIAPRSLFGFGGPW